MKKGKVKKIFAIIFLVMLLFLIAVLTYSLITANGRLAMAMIFLLIFLSILLYIIMYLYGKLTKTSK